MKSHSCEPTPTDTHVLEFCKKGYLVLEAVAQDKIKRRSFDFIEGLSHSEIQPRRPRFYPDSYLMPDVRLGGRIVAKRAGTILLSVLLTRLAIDRQCP